MNKSHFMAIAISCTAMILTSCYSSKKAEDQVARAYARHPEVVARLTKQWFPCVTTGTSSTIDTLKAIDSSAFYKSQADSLQRIKRNIKDSLAIRYKDSCRSVQENYDQGLALGYEIGFNDGKQICVPDTIREIRTVRVKDNFEIAELQEKNKKLEERLAQKVVWLKIFAGVAGLLLLIIGILYFLFRRKADPDTAKKY